MACHRNKDFTYLLNMICTTCSYMSFDIKQFNAVLVWKMRVKDSSYAYRIDGTFKLFQGNGTRRKSRCHL